MAENETDIKPKVKAKPKQLRYFISSLNTFVGQALVEAIRNDHVNDENPHLILGSINENESAPVPKGVFRVIDTSKVNFLSKVFLDSDVIIYDLNTCDLSEAEFAIKTLKMGSYTDDKILICISSVMVWSNTPPKEKGQEEGEGEAEEEPQSDQDQQDDKAEEEGVVKKVFVKFTEKDITLRKPLPNYEILKQIETLCISAGNSKPNLKSYVLCSGILYGNGEDVFYNHFKQAWLQNPSELQIIGDGKNRIPTIHVRDLATFVKCCVEKKPNQSYIFAIDHNNNPQQKKLVDSISKNLGKGGLKSISIEAASVENDDFDKFYIDVRMRPSKVFDQFEEEEGQQEEEDDPNAPPKFKFNWHCKEGMSKNIGKLIDEFNQFRGLRPNRILIQGPPGSGKSHLAKQLAKYYNIPHILVKDVVDQVKALQDELGEETKAAWEEQKEKCVEEALAAFEAEKKKKKGGKKGDPVEEFDEKKVVVRLPLPNLYKAYQWRLKQADCYNRGFIIDGFPKAFVQAQGVFMVSKQEGEDEQNEQLIVNQQILPESVIVLEGTDEFLKTRIKELREDQIANTHWNEEGMNRRLAIYRQNNNKDKGENTLVDFFKQNNVQALQVNVENNQNMIFDNIRSYIERNGSFSNYMTFEEEQEEIRKKQVNSNITKEQEAILLGQKQLDEKEEENRKIQQEEFKIKMENLKDQERKILDERSQPLRQYLADNVVPYLTEGLIELCKNPTSDPVDVLAEYLFKRSLEVQFPDPSVYNQ